MYGCDFTSSLITEHFCSKSCLFKLVHYSHFLLGGKGLFYFCSVSCVLEKIGLECIKAIFERRKLTKILE